MKRLYIFSWALILNIQCVEILSYCKDIKAHGERCSFENVYQPQQFPIQQIQRKRRKYVNISFNRSYIPELHADTFIIGPTKVRELAIINSQVVVVAPDSFVNFPELKKLHLDYNNLTQINQVFVAQKNLSELSLSHNYISSIDIDAWGLQSSTLTLLDLSFNRLSNLSPASNSKSIFSLLNNLSKLDLSNNKLEVLYRSTFANNSNLEFLNLSQNSLTELKLRNFDKLSKLISLNLSSNELSKLDIGFSIGLKSLEVLDLSSNKLSVLEPNGFHNLPKLRRLSLHSNLLRTVSIIDLKYSTKLSSISIHGNQMDCPVLSNCLKELKIQNIEFDEGLDTETYTLHGISCNLSSTTGKHAETTALKQTSQMPSSPAVKYFCEDFEIAFLNSSFYLLFNNFVENQTEKLVEMMRIIEDLSAKISANNRKIMKPETN